jgi:hypothetical protein
MKATNGLNVPSGYGGDGSVKLKGASRPVRKAQRAVPPRERNTLPAEQCEGHRVRGQRTGDAYEVMAVERPTDDERVVVLHVRNLRTESIRRWVHKVGFRLELA